MDARSAFHYSGFLVCNTALKKERGNWRLIGEEDGIHWSDLDEDISVEGLLAGRMSGESVASLQRWLDDRAAEKQRRHAGPRSIGLKK